MSTIVNAMRSLMAVMQPVTGDRATGVVTVKATSGTVTLPISSYAAPVVDGVYRSDLLAKVTEGPNADKSWTITTGGVDVNFTSNIGGARHNLLINTTLTFDPEISNIASAVVKANWANGADPTEFGGVRDMVIAERFEGPSLMLDQARSTLKCWPAVVIAWADSEPADGSTISMTVRETRAGTRRMLFKESFRIHVIVSRAEQEHKRREEGLDILDSITSLLTDRHDVDDVCFSNPSGVQVRQRWRETLPQRIYQKFYIYCLLVGVEVTLQQTDARTYVNLETVVFDVEKPQDPALPDQGDITVVDGVKVNMAP